MNVPIYKSIFKNKKALQESKQKQLKTIVEQLNVLKKKLREEDEDIMDVSTEETELNPAAISDIIDKVEDLVISAVETLGATDEVTSELIATAGSLEAMEDEEDNIYAGIAELGVLGNICYPDDEEDTVYIKTILYQETCVCSEESFKVLSDKQKDIIFKRLKKFGSILKKSDLKYYSLLERS